MKATSGVAGSAVATDGICPLSTLVARLAKSSLCPDFYLVIWPTTAREALGGAELILVAMLVRLAERVLDC